MNIVHNRLRVILSQFLHIPQIQPKLLFKQKVVRFEDRNRLILHPHPIQTIFAVTQLKNLSDGVAHCAVIIDHHAFHRFDETPLNVAGFRGFHRRINKTLATAHRVKKKFGGRQTGQVRIFDESTRLRTVVVFDEMRQGSMPKSKRNSLPFDVLLPDTRNNLKSNTTATCNMQTTSIISRNKPAKC